MLTTEQSCRDVRVRARPCDWGCAGVRSGSPLQREMTFCAAACNPAVLDSRDGGNRRTELLLDLRGVDPKCRVPAVLESVDKAREVVDRVKVRDWRLGGMPVDQVVRLTARTGVGLDCGLERAVPRPRTDEVWDVWVHLVRRTNPTLSSEPTPSEIGTSALGYPLQIVRPSVPSSRRSSLPDIGWSEAFAAPRISGTAGG